VRVGVNTEMQFAPAPRRADTAFLIQPFALTIDLQAGAIDKEVQRLFTTNQLCRAPHKRLNAANMVMRTRGFASCAFGMILAAALDFCYGQRFA
jgi:hypothetical protein